MENLYKTVEVKMLPVLPLKNLVALPKSIIPVVVGRDISIKAVEYALEHGKEVFVTAQKSMDIEHPAKKDLFEIGTKATILQSAVLPNNSIKILIEGNCRAKINKFVEADKKHRFFMAEIVDLLPVPLEDNIENKALWRNIFDLFTEYVRLNEKVPEDILNILSGIQDFDYLMDTVAVQIPLNFQARQEFLETIDLKKRALKLSLLLENELEVLRAEKNIRKRVQRQIEKNQKDYYLHEQMRAIQRELGRDDYQQEINELREKAKKLKLPAQAQEKVDSELKRLESMQPTSPEASVSRNYVDWLLSVPWHQATKDDISFEQAQKILDSSHAGMKKVKDRIIEFLAAKKFAGAKLKKSPIICLVGPPGVGKTSLAISIAQSLGRKLVRISLGGMRDEAEIRGHRRTYIGAMPGKIIQAMKTAKVLNPVIVLDEIDKMATDFRGDPASALLEVLDPEQNREFTDYFLEVGYDLSKVMFITTANVADNIPYPLLDRMELIYLSGYTQQEKLEIAKKFLLPKLFQEYAFKPEQIRIDDDIIKSILEEYVKEAGVRQLERVLATILRKSIQELLDNKKLKIVNVTAEKLEKWLGSVKFKKPDKRFEEKIGVVTGLAWTEVGGDLLEVEIAVMKGKGALTITGQLGEVMQESAQAAMTYIRSRSKDLGLKEDFYSELDIHIHVPEGAIPKDGPSAGITMATALASALSKVPVYKDIAMTGEVTLQGRVLPVGGLKEKLLAAIRNDIKKVFVPKDNFNDIKEFITELDDSLELVYVDNMDTVLSGALTKFPIERKEEKKKNKKSNKNSKVVNKPDNKKKRK
ncbi:endopeptidase La [Candidatus Babeliales bacterium]|nr:endopeptidase La [Candidatus Babeliales bacterium]